LEQPGLEIDNTVDISTMAIVQSQYYGPLLAVLGKQNGQPLGLVASFDACGGLSWRASIPLPGDFGKISDPNSTLRRRNFLGRRPTTMA
jgi:hypothetical protein